MPRTEARCGISGKSARSQPDHSPWEILSKLDADGGIVGVHIDNQIYGREWMILAERVRRSFERQHGVAVR
jgi:hypothetical protein